MKYAPIQIVFHWLTAGLLVAMAASGMAYSYELIGDGVLVFHQWAGQILIVLLAARIATRLLRRSPTAVTSHAKWEQLLASVTHLALYLCLIAYVATGYVSASALGDTSLLVPANIGFARSDMGEQLLELHFALKWVLLGLVALHLFGVLKHALWDRDTTLSNMTFTSSKG